MKPDTTFTPDTTLNPDDERALRWLQRRLEWEEILGALRAAGRRETIAPAPPKQEPAAA